MIHPSKDILGTKGNKLQNKRIVLCITGSVAATQCPEIARELMRHGAEVYAVMSPMAQKIIHPNLMEWATGNPVVTELTGKIEHVMLAGEHKDKADLILVAPATANTISKIASGIDDTPVTTVVSTALGAEIPVIIVPAMHESMYKHPILKENMKKLKALNVWFVGPKVEEGKAKIAETQEIVNAVIERLNVKMDLAGKKLLITGGPTIEHIDPVRVITNKSSGKMAVSIAREALLRGAEVTLIYGPGSAEPPSEAHVVRVETSREMLDNVLSELKQRKYDVVVAAAAVADWALEKPYNHKISTRDTAMLSLKLKPTPKIIDAIRKACPDIFLVAFRAEYGLSDKELVEAGAKWMKRARADLVVVNDVGRKSVGFGFDTNEVFILDAKGKVVHVPLSMKREVAKKLLDVIVAKLGRK
ncbi:MAG: bifunctional phosphopantothenoylcysteine decarboxylase/phosphopantothenate--cysteine ligase CoaBC [Candidatus Bathyarchaeia archaeon]